MEEAASRVRSVGVIGGGTAGYFAALAIRAHRPDLEVVVVESSAIPIIGVGEATTTLMPPFLHRQLGIDPVELWQAVRPTFKLGIRFEWGRADPAYHFSYPFGEANLLESALYDGSTRTQSLVSLMMDDDRGPVAAGPGGQLLPLLSSLKFAYHLDNAPFVRFLQATARARGIRVIDRRLDGVQARTDGPGVEALHGEGHTLRFDAYIDATGFRSLLMGTALESPFISYRRSLFCDRAVVARVPQSEVIRPYTTAECMENGWCWRIPVRGEDHRGYVFASDFISDDDAIAEMRAKNPGMDEPWKVHFRSGRHRDFWVGNTFAIGNAYGFVEPLESTALHMVIIEIGYVLAGLDAMFAGREVASARAFVNETIGAHWDYLRWFLAIHYKFNRRSGSRFWQEVRAHGDVSGFEALLQEFRADPAATLLRGERSHPGRPATFSLLPILLGQEVPWDHPPRKVLDPAAWRSKKEGFAKVLRWTLPQREALRHIDENPAWLRDFIRSPRSWCSGHEAIELPPLP